MNLKTGDGSNRSACRKTALTALLACCIILALALCGCSGSGGSSSSNGSSSNSGTKTNKGLEVPEKEYAAVLLVVGNTANEPAPTLAKSLQPYLNSAYLSQGFTDKKPEETFVIVSAAGASDHPLIHYADSVYSNVKNIQKFPSENEKINTEIATALNTSVESSIATSPTASHLDFMGAVKEGVKQLDNINGDKLMIVIGSGLNDTGMLNFASNPSLINEDPSAIAQRLTSDATTHISGSTLEGYDVVIAGLGNTTYPQTPLENEGTDSRGNLVSIYKSIYEAMGGKIISVDTSTDPSGKAIDTPYTVVPTVFNQSQALVWNTADGKPDSQPVEWHFTDESLAFKPSSSEFLDSGQAKKSLSAVADELAAHPDTKITIAGYEARVSLDSPVVDTSELTTARANAVRDFLVNDLGVNAGQIAEVKGAGTGQFVDEFNADGSWNKEVAYLNRVVVISVVK